MTIKKALTTWNVGLGQVALVWRFNMRFPEAMRTCRLLQPVADRLTEAMAKLTLRPPSMPYVSNRGDRALHEAQAIREDLASGVAHAVRWYETLEVLRELGANVFIEMPPGHVSTHLAAELLPGMKAVAIADQGLRYATVVARRENSSIPDLTID